MGKDANKERMGMKEQGNEVKELKEQGEKRLKERTRKERSKEGRGLGEGQTRKRRGQRKE